MGKLAGRLLDAARSGVYRATRAEEVEDACKGTKLALLRVSLEGAYTKEDVLDRLAHALGFPEWFGRNWDALEDCLTDLSWRPAGGHVLLLEGFLPGDVLGILIDILGSGAEYWASRGTPFFAVFVDPERTLGLPALFRGA